MDLALALSFAGARSKGVLITIRADGRPQSSNVLYLVDGPTLTMSLTADRAKTANLRRDPRAVMHVNDDTFWQYVALDGGVELSAVAAEPSDPTVEGLVDYYRRLNGEHPDWADYRSAMVEERRLLARLTVTSAYGQIST